MVFLNRVAVVLVIVGALLFGLRDGTTEALQGHPEALWHDGVRQVDAMITDGTEEQISTSFAESVDLAEGLGTGVGDIAP